MPIVTSGSNLTLVGALFGGRTERCQWMLEELNVDYQHDPMQVLKGVPSTMEEYEQNATHNPEVVALNPRAKIPLLKDASNDLLLAESAAINNAIPALISGEANFDDFKEDLKLCPITLAL